MKVFYRICPFPNGKSALFTNDKLKLTEFCLKSFVRAFKDVKPEMTFILDSCPDEYAKMIFDNVPFKKDILSFDGLGNEGSFHMQLSMAATYDGPVMLQEDDYFYLNEVGSILDDALKCVEKWFDNDNKFFTPYDHPDYYNKEWHNYEKVMHYIGDCKWMRVDSTCLTFATNGKTIKKYLDIIKSFGTADHPMWVHLKKLGCSLYSAFPSLATHMDKEFLAPNINWQEEFEKNI